MNNNSSDLLKHLTKYPLILPKPSSSGPVTAAVITENDQPQQAGPSRVSKRNTHDEDMGSPTKRKSLRLDEVESLALPSEIVSLLQLIEMYYHGKGDHYQFMSACHRSSKNYKRLKAVHECLQVCNIHKDTRTATLKIWGKFFKKLEQYQCFSVNEIVAVKNTLNLLDGHYHLKGEDALISQDQPPLNTLIQRFEDERLRYIPPDYPIYSASYKRAAAVLDTVENCDIYGHLNSDTIKRFFGILTCCCLFDKTEIAAVKKHMYSVMRSRPQNSSKKVIQPLYAIQPSFCRGQNEESLVTDPIETRSVTEPTESSLVAEPVETSSVTEPIETSCPTLPTLCPICQQNVGEDDVWHHILKTHVEWERAVKHDNTFSDTKFCTHCFQTGFGTLRDVMKHETRTHGTNTENSCTFCGATCHDIFGYYRHVVELHGVLYQCPKCCEEFCLKNDFIQHLKKLHEIKYSAVWWRHRARYFCPFCNARFTCHEKTVNHLFNKYNASKSDLDFSKQLLCFSCGTSFQTHKNLSDHLQSSDSCNCKELKIKAEHRSFVCYSCKERFETRAALDFHQSPTANFVLTAPISNTGPRNFKKKVFSVTCDLKRLRRVELDRHPQALDSMLNSFETLHKSDKQLCQYSKVRILPEDERPEVNKKVEIKQDRNNPAIEINDMIALASENTEQNQSVSIKHKPRKGTKHKTRNRSNGKNEVVPIVIDNEDRQPKIQPVTVNDGQGNTVIINNQSGGSNTIILGGCCSRDGNQQANPPSSITPSLSVSEHYPRSARGLANLRDNNQG